MTLPSSPDPSSFHLGTFWGVSVGPGRPDWLTLQALRVLQQAPVIACPQNRQGQAGLAYDIIAEHLQGRSVPPQILPLDLPFVQDPDQLQQAWQTAVDQLLPPLQAGQDVACIALGDVGLYSTLTYLAAGLRQTLPQVPIEILPGVCSPLAAAARLGLPLSIWAEKIAILPALHQISELEAALAWAEVVVLLKVGSVFGQVWDLLAKRQLLGQASLVEAAGQINERLHPTLEGLQGYHPPYFSLVIIRPQPHPWLTPLPADKKAVTYGPETA